MDISEKLTQQQLQDILFDIMVKGNESTNLNVTDVIDEIKHKLVTAIGTPE